MANLRVAILRYTHDSQPGWVECAFRDALGREHIFHEKVPVVTNESLDACSDYPRPGSIACEVVGRRSDENARIIVKIDTSRPWGCETTDGATIFDVLPEQVTDASE